MQLRIAVIVIMFVDVGTKDTPDRRNGSMIHSSAKPPAIQASASAQFQNAAIPAAPISSATPTRIPPPNGTMRRAMEGTDSATRRTKRRPGDCGDDEGRRASDCCRRKF